MTHSRIVQAKTSRHLLGTWSATVGSSRVDAGALQSRPGLGDLAEQRDAADSERGRTHVGQGVARQPSPGRRARARQRSGSTSSSRCASSALTVMTVSEWPRMSCRSRAIRERSSSSASAGDLVLRGQQSLVALPGEPERPGRDRGEEDAEAVALVVPAVDDVRRDLVGDERPRRPTRSPPPRRQATHHHRRDERRTGQRGLAWAPGSHRRRARRAARAAPCPASRPRTGAAFRASAAAGRTRSRST